ncbi:uncharacterized protein LOC118184965 [Stegodyphus dumicola]|uniref:uncharacterized protein LOC118184965 n=1 Tax=Stegodyphus dumicola TaxID=202533 RepID=UPI0015AEED1E|nr:uncharacterized protein LOC118184965 [Stegodyphus dumicola]
MTYTNEFKSSRISERNIKGKHLKGLVRDKIYLGSDVKIPCFIANSMAKRLGASNFLWERALKKQVLNGKRFSVDKHGVLTIRKASIEDAGLYFCKAQTNSGFIKVNHIFIVKQLPSARVHVIFVYAIKDCKEENEAITKIFVQSKIRGKVCITRKCKIGNIVSNCHFAEPARASLRVTVPVIIPAIPNAVCEADCSVEKVKEDKDRVTRQIVGAVMSGSGLKLSEKAEEVVSYYETDEDMICDPGFEKKDSESKLLCVPCEPGHFLDKGYCIPCRLNEYTEHYAAAECKHCGEGFKTKSRGAKSKEECYIGLDPKTAMVLFIISLFTVMLVLTCCIWCIRKYAGNSVLGICLDFCCNLLLCNFTSSKLPKLSEGSYSRGTKDNESSEESVQSESASSHTSSTYTFKDGQDAGFKEVRAPWNKSSKIPRAPVMPTDSMMKSATRNSRPSAFKNKTLQKFKTNLDV